MKLKLKTLFYRNIRHFTKIRVVNDSGYFHLGPDSKKISIAFNKYMNDIPKIRQQAGAESCLKEYLKRVRAYDELDYVK